MRALILCLGLSVAIADESVPPSGPPCRSVADCWLDDSGQPIARPKKERGKPLPRGNCGGRINWLRNQLNCVEHRCVAFHVGDRC